jgi:hypothetical protein
MPNNKDNNMSGSERSMSDSSMTDRSDREFESQGQNQGSRGSGEQTGSSRGYGKETGSQGNMDYGKETGSQGNMDDDEMNTAGGRKGHFSDQNRDSEGQWSPGASGGSSDQ